MSELNIDDGLRLLESARSSKPGTHASFVLIRQWRRWRDRNAEAMLNELRYLRDIAAKHGIELDAPTKGTP